MRRWPAKLEKLRPDMMFSDMRAARLTSWPGSAGEPPDGAISLRRRRRDGSARAGIFDRAGKVLGRAEHPILMYRPKADHAEHDSEDIWRRSATPCAARWRRPA